MHTSVLAFLLVACGGTTPLRTGDDAAAGDCDPIYPCRLTAPQCGCHDGERCLLEADERVCVPSSPAAAPSEGEPCGAMGTDDCLDGMVCDDRSPTPPSCRRFCEDDSDCTGDGGRCGVPPDRGPDATVCSIDCDPRLGTGCPDGANCDVFQTPEGAATDCQVPTGPGVQGDACGGPDAAPPCAQGFACTLGTCRHYCEDPGERDAGCSAYQTCEPFDPPMEIGDVELGTCL